MIACQPAHQALRPPSEPKFTFTFNPLPLAAPLKFSAAVFGELSSACKRARPVEDVDGTAFVPRKKRRIRFSLVTSRLSQPYAVPTTHIIDRGPCKIAVWARRRALFGRNHLRKAAILNRARRNRARGEAMPSPPAALKPDPLPQVAGEENEMREPPPRFVPLPPSPLGFSNYDALDDDYPMGEGDDGDESSRTGYYSDFSVMAEDEDIPIIEGREPKPGNEKLVEMTREKERQKEVLFVKFTWQC